MLNMVVLCDMTRLSLLYCYYLSQTHSSLYYPFDCRHARLVWYKILRLISIYRRGRVCSMVLFRSGCLNRNCQPDAIMISRQHGIFMTSSLLMSHCMMGIERYPGYLSLEQVFLHRLRSTPARICCKHLQTGGVA
jgi:hypothetical protein